MRLTSFVLVAVLAAACSKLSSDYCGSDPCPIDAPMPIDATSGCNESPDLCTATEECINDECLDCNTTADRESVDCTVAGMPVCRADSTCTPCGADAECNSGVCEAGSCIAATNVVYVATDGTATSGCNVGAPCSTMAQGLSEVGGARQYLNVAPGTYAPTTATTINADVTIRADGVIFERNGNDQILNVTGGNVTIIGAMVRNAAGSANADGIKCENAASLRLVRVVDDNSADRGIEATDCRLTITRSVISNNDKSGVRLEAGSIDITNSFVVGNGGLSEQIGGLDLAPTMPNGRIEFTTIRKNIAAPGRPGALDCAGMRIRARNNIIYGSVNTDVEVLGSCDHSTSIIGPANTPVAPEVISLPVADIAFVDVNGTTAAALHIGLASMARGLAEPGTTTGDTSVDYDGHLRPTPTGGRADLGADEVP